jgi:flagellar biosynthesis protein FlhF
MQAIVREIKFLRGLLEGQLAGLAWGEMQRHSPDKLEIFRQMLAMGLSPALCRQLIDHLPDKYDYANGLKWVKAALLRNLQAVKAGEDMVERGGVYALVGPTGVGKTTTVAKIAARATVKFGPDSVALVTTDSYRIGAHDQLRIYGKILNVQVHATKDETDLQLTLADLADRHLVLIDTVGMGQRDKRVTEQVAMLAGEGNVQRLLLLAANAQGTTLEDVVQRYKGDGLSGCIYSKIDEAISIGNGLDIMIRHKLPLHYVTNGQRVPEDLHLANPLYLLDRAFKTAQDNSAFKLKTEEYPLYLGANSGLNLDLDDTDPTRG